MRNRKSAVIVEQPPAVPDRNARRRELYAKNPEYRAKAVQRSRQGYREANGGILRHINCAPNIKTAASFGTHREYGPVSIGNRPGHKGYVSGISFSMEELGKVLGGYNVQNIHRWYRNGQLPRPTMTSANVSVYSLDEVLAIMPILAQHQAERAYFLKRHTDTVQKIADAIRAVRQQKGFPLG